MICSCGGQTRSRSIAKDSEPLLDYEYCGACGRTEITCIYDKEKAESYLERELDERLLNISKMRQ